MMKKPNLRTLAATVLALASLPLFGAAKPNVLMIVVDDLSSPAIRHPAYGTTHNSALTPSLDRLINGGVAFTQASANWPSCAPARQAFMSGALAEKTGYRFYGNVREEAGRNRSLVYMGEHFKNNGYSTIRLDKIYHIGRDVPHQWDLTEEPFGANRDRVVQQAREFDTLGLTTGDRLRYAKFTEMGGEKSEIIELKPAKADGTPITANTLTDGITKLRALAVLDDLATPGGQFDASVKPFFLAVGFRRPHLPFTAPTSYYRKFKWGNGDTNFEPGASNLELPPVNQTFTNENEYRQALEGYYACLLMTDDHIGEILDKLDATGLANDTIVVFFGDHGYGLGEHDKYFAKGTPDNVGFHTPLIFRVPGGRQNAAISKAVTLVDVYPTLSDLCGLPRPETPLDGSSLVPLLQKDDPDWVENAIAFLGDNDDASLPLLRFIWADGYKYFEEDGAGPKELYAVGRGDQFEWTNLVSSAPHAGVRTSLKNRMDSLMLRSRERVAPDLQQHPQSLALPAGRPALFTIRAAGAKPVTVQWYKNGIALAGETRTSLVIPAVAAAHAGTYSATVRNEVGRTFSYRAELRVLASAGELFDWQIDNTHAPYILDGINGAPFETIPPTSGTFNSSLQVCYYSDRDGFGYVRPGVPYGTYRVSIHRHGFSNGTTSAAYTVKHLAGDSTTNLNMSDSTRGWQLLGTYTLGPRSELKIGTLVPVGERNSKYVTFDGARFERTAAPANAVPVANAETPVSTAPDTAVTVNVLANDTDGDGDALSIYQISGGLLGSVSFSGGSVTYTPHPGVVTGTDTLYYQATDGKDVSGPASLVVTISQPANSSVVSTQTNDGGTVGRSGNKTTYTNGTNVTFTATPHPGFQFYHWDGSVQSTQNPLSLPVSSNTQLTAVFRPLTAITSYAAWSGIQQWTAPGTQNPRVADPDADGWNNLAEYAFDLDPLAADGRPDVIELPASGGSDLSFRYRRNLRAQGVTYAVKVSEDLVDWQAIAGPQVVSNFNPDGDFTAQEVEVTVPGGTRRFVRVEAVVP